MFERSFKILFIGDRAVGKTTLLNRILSNTFEPIYIPEIRASLAEKDLKVCDCVFRLLFWDIKGTQNITGIGKIFADTNAVVSLFDVCNPRSLNVVEKQCEVTRWLHNPIFWLVGNKIDLAEYRMVDRSVAIKVAKKIKANYEEISAKTGENVEKLFTSILKALIEARLKELKLTLSE